MDKETETSHYRRYGMELTNAEHSKVVEKQQRYQTRKAARQAAREAAKRKAS